MTLDETVDSEEQDIREEQRRGRWSFGQDHDPVVSAIKSMKDLFPNVRVSMDPTTSLKLRKRIYPLKTVLTLGADYNTQIGVWQFRSTWEDSIIGGRISIAGREVMLTKSWLLKVMDQEDVATRLKFRAAINTRDWTAYAKFGFRTERISPLNIKDGFQLAKKIPLDGLNGTLLPAAPVEFMLFLLQPFDTSSLREDRHLTGRLVFQGSTKKPVRAVSYIPRNT